MFRVYFKTESYRKLDEMLALAEENRYDPIKEKVNLYSPGAYGVIISPHSSSIEKFLFNKCIKYFIKNLTNHYGN